MTDPQNKSDPSASQFTGSTATTNVAAAAGGLFNHASDLARTGAAAASANQGSVLYGWVQYDHTPFNLFKASDQLGAQASASNKPKGNEDVKAATSSKRKSDVDGSRDDKDESDSTRRKRIRVDLSVDDNETDDKEKDGADSKSSSAKCPHAGCAFFQGPTGYCSLHVPVEARTSVLKTAADRERAAASQWKQYQQTQVMTAYEARFQSYLMSADDYKGVTNIVATISHTPATLLQWLTEEKWLLTADQAHQLYDIIKRNPEINKVIEDNKLSAFEISLCCRVMDRDRLLYPGSEGYYAQQRLDKFYSDTVNLSQFCPFPDHVDRLW